MCGLCKACSICVCVLLGFVTAVFAQQRVNPRNIHERIWCVVPMVGSGTPEDPRRPLFAPVPGAPGEQPSRDGIIAFTYQESDDGRFALAEFVALERAAFTEILAERDRRADVKVFVKGEARRSDIETEFRRWKRGFSFDRFGVRVP
jgi:hypothetical protein